MHPLAGTACVCSTPILVQVLVLVLALVQPLAGYNLDQEHSLEFSGPPSSMFGYSVLLYRNGDRKWSAIYLLLILSFPILPNPIYSHCIFSYLVCSAVDPLLILLYLDYLFTIL